MATAGEKLHNQRQRTGIAGISVVVGLALMVSGCAFSMNEFGTADRNPDGRSLAAAEVSGQESAIPLGSSALLEDPNAVRPPATAAATVAVRQAPGYPNLNAPTGDPRTKLLSPEEKAEVIAELEALARQQGSTIRKPKAAECLAGAVRDGNGACIAPAKD
jgi:hypothetical protein